MIIKQLIRSASSVCANFIEAYETISVKSKISILYISKREIKESIYWLELLNKFNNTLQKEITFISIEALEIAKIISSIINKIKR
jgi:four helix bundle protein